MSSRVAVILQPSYLPWLGYFAQLHRSDVFVVYDDVQFDKDSWRNRNRVKAPDGPQWLTVPVRTTGRGRPSNREIEIDNTAAWQRKHRRALAQHYAKAPFFADYIGVFDDIYARSWQYLLDLNLECFTRLADALGVQRQIRLASELGIAGDRTTRLIEICRAVGADTFYEGAAGRDYLDDAPFAAAGIALEYQDYRHPVYPQLYPPFVPYLSAIDLLFNCGPNSLEVLVR